VFLIVLLACSFFFSKHAHAAVFYFNNAVNTSPNTLGNYWNDQDATDPALSLPDFSVDEVSVLSGATFTGNARFNGNARNEGTVNGNAIFYGNNSLNDLSVTGTQTRYYISPTTKNNKITNEQNRNPWIVLTDNDIIKIFNE